MRHTVLGAVFALCVSAVLSLGCDSGGPPAANSFTKVYTETIQPKCSNDFCHYNGVGLSFSGLDLSSKVRAYSSLVGMPCMGSCYQRGTRVVPDHSEESVFYLKLLLLDQMPDAAAVRCGSQMPADTTGYRTNGLSVPTFLGCQDAGEDASESATPCRPPATLPAEEQNRIHDWIQEGAKYN
jgi:hypothetical protein